MRLSSDFSKYVVAIIFAFALSACGVKTSIRSTYFDRIAPTDPVSLSWLQTSPFNQNALTATWTPSTAPDYQSQKIQFYSDNQCEVLKGSKINLSSKTTSTQALSTANDGAYSYRIYSYDHKGNEGISKCSPPMVVDTTPPVITISVPQNNGFINIASDSTNYKIAGACSEEGRTVTIKSDGATIGTATCLSGAFDSSIPDLSNTPVNSTQMTAASHLITAMISDLATNSTTSSAVNVTRDVTAPANATSLTWTHSSPVNTNSITASWTVSTSTDLANQSIQYYADGVCSIAVGSPLSLSTSAHTSTFTGTDGQTYSYKITTTDLAGNPSTSACSSPMVIDTSVPTVTITTAATWISNSNKAAYAVSGACGDVGTGISGGNVTVKLNDGTTIKTSTVICDNGAYTATFNTTAATALTEGTNHITATASVTDLAGNSTTATQSNRSKDTVSPTLSLTSASIATWINVANKAAYVVSGTCSDATSGLNGNITVTMTDGTNTANGAVTATTTCTGAGTFSTTMNVSTLVDGSSNISITASVSDAAGNATTTAVLTRSKDTVAPTSVMKFASNGLDWEDKNSLTSGNLTTTLTSINCTDQSKVMFTTTNTAPAVSDSGWATCATTAGAFSRTINSPTEATANVFYAWSKDAADNISASKALTLTYDITPPTVTGIDVNGTETTTINNNTLVSLSASSARNDIWAFCLKYNDTATPSLSSSCWTTTDTAIGVSRTQNLSMSGTGRFPYRLGTILGTYNVRMWVRDAAGNISVMSNSGAGTQGNDLDSIYYNPDVPPVLSNVVASKTNPPTFPLDSTQTTIQNGDTVYIRWNATDNNTLPSNGITIEYTTNESTYTTIASGLNPVGNNGTDCTVDAASTGCYKWTSTLATGTYFKIRVTITDSGVSSVVSHTNGLNSGFVNFLAGNTSLGFDGSANSALFIGKNESTYNDAHDNGALVVTKTGMVFFKYLKGTTYDLAYVDPANGILKTLMKYTGTSSASGTNALGGTLKGLYRIALDYRGNLIIWDYTLIRRVNLNVTPWTVETLADIGITTTEYPLFTVAPNGRIYYEQFPAIKFLKPTDSTWQTYSKETLFNLTGLGAQVNSYVSAADAAIYDNFNCTGHTYYGIAFDKSNTDSNTAALTKIIRRANSVAGNVNCGNITAPNYNSGMVSNFDPATGVAMAPHPPLLDWSSTTYTGMDGKMYSLKQGRSVIQRYNPTNNLFETVVGNGTNGRCVDGTLWNACPVIAMSIFVDEFGTIFFNDMGVIRFKDQDGKIQTLAGQPRNFGVGQNPLSARFSRVNYFDVDSSNNDVYLTNRLERNLVKFSLSGGNLQLVAGNGSGVYPAQDSVAASTDLATSCGWSYPCGFKVDPVNRRLYHMTSSWGLMSYINLNTGKWVVRSDVTIQDTSARLSYVGINGNDLMIHAPSHGGTTTRKTFRLVSRNPATDAYTNVNLLGVDSYVLSSTLPGWMCAAGTSATSCGLNDDLNEGYQTQIKYDSTYGWMLAQKGSSRMVTVDGSGLIQNFTTVLNGVSAYDFRRVGSTEIVYYCGNNGALYKRTLAGTSGGTEVNLPLTGGIQCFGSALHYHTGRNSLIFIYTFNGMFGLAEYVNP